MEAVDVEWFTCELTTINTNHSSSMSTDIKKPTQKESVNLEPEVGVEPTYLVYETRVIPLYDSGEMELLVGIGPTFPHYQ